MQIAVTIATLVVIVAVVPWRDRAEVHGLGEVRVLEDRGMSLVVMPIHSSSNAARMVERAKVKAVEPGLASLLANARLASVVGYLSCALAMAIVLALRWRLLLCVGAAMRPSFVWCIVNWGRSQVISALPTSQIGGDFFRAQRTTSLGHGWITAWAIVALERLCGLAALCLVAAIGLSYSGLVSAAHLAIAGFALGSVGVATIGLRSTISRLYRATPRTLPICLARLQSFLSERLTDVAKSLPRDRRALVGVFLLSVTAQTLSPLSFVFVDRALGLDTPVWCYLVAIPALALAQYLPIHIAGIGLVEGGLWLTLSHWAGRSGAEVIALSAASRILSLLWLSALACMFLVHTRQPFCATSPAATVAPIIPRRSTQDDRREVGVKIPTPSPVLAGTE